MNSRWAMMAVTGITVTEVMGIGVRAPNQNNISHSNTIPSASLSRLIDNDRGRGVVKWGCGSRGEYGSRDRPKGSRDSVRGAATRVGVFGAGSTRSWSRASG